MNIVSQRRRTVDVCVTIATVGAGFVPRTFQNAEYFADVADGGSIVDGLQLLDAESDQRVGTERAGIVALVRLAARGTPAPCPAPPRSSSRRRHRRRRRHLRRVVECRVPTTRRYGPSQSATRCASVRRPGRRGHRARWVCSEIRRIPAGRRPGPTAHPFPRSGWPTSQR